MFEQFNKIRSVFEGSKGILQTYLDGETVSSFETNFKNRMDNSKPVVMVYGVYNAGKSTLLNALIGQELAVYADVPQTARIETYQIGDVEILDTPGIDAPIEHEEVSREQLTRSDAVIFVLCSDGIIDEKQTYQEIRKILEAGKHLLIVINNKNNFKPNDENLLALKDQFRKNLYSYFANDESILSQLDTVEEYLVNAKVAMKGRVDNKPKLVEHSKIVDLEIAVERLFEKTNSAQVAHTLSFELKELLEDAKVGAQQQVDKTELSHLNDWISKAENMRQALESRTFTKAEKDKPSLVMNISNSIISDDEAKVSQHVEAWYEDNIAYFEHHLERTFKQLDLEAGELVKILASSPSTSGYFTDNDSTGSLEKNSGLSSLLSGLTKVGGKNMLSDEMAKKGIIYALKQGKALAPDLFKGIGQKTMEKMAAKIVPFIGPAIEVISSIFDYYKAKKEEERQLNNERQRIESIKLNVNKLVEDLYDTYYEAIQDTIEDAFVPIIRPIETSLELLSAQSGSIESDVRAISRSIEALDRA